MMREWLTLLLEQMQWCCQWRQVSKQREWWVIPSLLQQEDLFRYTVLQICEVIERVEEDEMEGAEHIPSGRSRELQTESQLVGVYTSIFVIINITDSAAEQKQCNIYTYAKAAEVL